MSADAAQQAAGTADASARFAWYSLSAWFSFWINGASSVAQRLLPQRLSPWRRKQE